MANHVRSPLPRKQPLARFALLSIFLAFVALLSPESASAKDIGEIVGYYVAPPAGALATFLFVLWVARKLESKFILNCGAKKQCHSFAI